MQLRQTDLPEPVVPAISKCGIFAISVQVALPAMSFPSATLSLLFAFLKTEEDMISRKVTSDLCWFGISIPTADLFGIGASIRTPAEARFSAMSSARFVILLILTPGAGCSS